MAKTGTDAIEAELVPTTPMTEHTTNTADDDFRQSLVDDSSPIDGSATELAIKETTIADLEKSSVWAALQAQEYAEIIAHRKKWSDALLKLVSFIIISDFIVVFLVGIKKLSYTGSFAVPAFIGSSILEIFGLSYIVVQYLFPNDKNGKKGTNRDKKEDA